MVERLGLVMANRPQLIVPYVVEDTFRGERVYDVYSRLVKDRIIFLGTPIDDQVANVIIAQLIFLSGEDPNKEISIYINSPVRQVYSGMAMDHHACWASAALRVWDASPWLCKRFCG